MLKTWKEGTVPEVVRALADGLDPDSLMMVLTALRGPDHGQRLHDPGAPERLKELTICRVRGVLFSRCSARRHTETLVVLNETSQLMRTAPLTQAEMRERDALVFDLGEGDHFAAHYRAAARVIRRTMGYDLDVEVPSDGGEEVKL